MPSLMNWLEAGRRLAERIPYSLVVLVARLAVASVFWRSGQTKVEGFLALLLLIVARGPGALSLDHLIWTRTQPQPVPAR